MEETIFSGGIGEGVVLESGETLEQFYQIDQSPVTLGNCRLVVGENTVMDGYFTRPVMYAGKQGNKLFFLLGTAGGNLFEQPKTYYETMLWLTESRFFRSYSWQGGRDLNFKEGKWK